MIPNNFTQGHLLKIEWLVLNVTLVGSHPDRAECDMFEDDFGHFSASSGCYCGLGPLCDLSGPLTERDIFWDDFGQFLVNSGHFFVAKEPLCDLGIPS